MPESLENARQKRELDEQEVEDQLTLADFCVTEDEYKEVMRGEQPAQVCRRRDAFYGGQ